MSKTTWDLSPFFKSDTDPAIAKWRNEVQTKTTQFATKWRKNSGYLTDSKTLLAALKESDELMRKHVGAYREVVYFNLRSSQDETDPKVRAKLNQAVAFSKDLTNETSFFTLNLSKIPKAAQNKLLADKDLAPYRYWLQCLFTEGAHTLTEAEEKILNLKSDPAHSNWVQMTSTLLAKETAEIKDASGKKTSVNLQQLVQALSGPSAKVRDAAAIEINRILAKHADVAENEVNSILQDKQIEDKLRGFVRPDSSRHLSDGINPETVDTLSNAVAAHFKIAGDFYRLKAQLLKLPQLRYHERNIEFGEVNKKFTYEQSCDIVKSTFRKLDPEFEQITQAFISESRMDVYPNQGKSGGAYCASSLSGFPVFIMLNHSNRLDDVMTMAHELGHGINFELVRKHQLPLNYSVSLAVAEVASTFMEDFVLEAIAGELTDKARLDLLMTKLNADISTIFRQIACYRFEQELHDEFRKSGYLTKEQIGKIFQKNMAAYMGKYVEQSAGSENWWVYWSHIRNFFYVYSYSSGLLISKALQRKVRRDPTFISEVKEFLSAGNSSSPEDTFKKLGLDITQTKFWEEGIAEISDNLKEATRLAKKLGRI